MSAKKACVSPRRIAVSELSLYVKGLEKADDLTYDVDADIYWRARSKEEYDKIRKDIETFEIERKDYTVYAWCDASSYEYWKKENAKRSYNYITITVKFNDACISEAILPRLKEDLETMKEHFEDYEISEY